MTDVQGDLFAPPEVVAAATQAGIDAADDHADEAWKRGARLQIELLARTLDEFTTDELIEKFDLVGISTHKHNLLALGGVLQRAARDGLIFNTGRVRATKIARRHRKLTVWGSVPRAER